MSNDEPMTLYGHWEARRGGQTPCGRPRGAYNKTNPPRNQQNEIDRDLDLD